MICKGCNTTTSILLYIVLKYFSKEDLIKLNVNLLYCYLNMPTINKTYHILSCLKLCLQGGPYYDLLHSLLGAYACYRPDVGYVSILYVQVDLVYFMLHVTA
jgi:hypothetical protein